MWEDNFGEVRVRIVYRVVDVLQHCWGQRIKAFILKICYFRCKGFNSCFWRDTWSVLSRRYLNWLTTNCLNQLIQSFNYVLRLLRLMLFIQNRCILGMSFIINEFFNYPAFIFIIWLANLVKTIFKRRGLIDGIKCFFDLLGFSAFRKRNFSHLFRLIVRDQLVDFP